MKHVFIFTNIAPHYRETLWSKLLMNKEIDYHFFYGEYNKSGIKTIDFNDSKYNEYHNKLHSIKNLRFKNRVLLWQRGVISTCLNNKFEFAIFLGEMYCISTWISSIICKIRNIKVIYWGHGVYGNEKGIKAIIRIGFLKLANKHLLYERSSKKILVSKGFCENNLYVVFNSLDYYKHLLFRNEIKRSKAEVFSFFKDSSLPVLIFIGRLRSIKRIDMLIESVFRINRDSYKINLIIIGNGPEREILETKAKVGIERKFIQFLGAIYDEMIISEFMYHADLCVSPGHVGLTAIHSLSLGTPVITHDNFPKHAPEVEAIVDGVNGAFFKEDDKNDLITKIIQWANTEKERSEIRRNCYEVIDRYYNPDYQITVFEHLVNNHNPEI